MLSVTLIICAAIVAIVLICAVCNGVVEVHKVKNGYYETAAKAAKKVEPDEIEPGGLSGWTSSCREVPLKDPGREP